MNLNFINFKKIKSLKFLTINLFIGLMIINSQTETIAQTPDMNKRPESLESKDFTFPEFKEKTLSNGLRIFFIEDKEQPTLNLNFVFKGGKVAESKPDVADFTATLLTKGTKSKSALIIAETIDGIGADISANSSLDYFSISAFTLTKHQDKVLEILADIMLNPAFDDDELEKLVPKALAGLKSEKSNIGSLAAKMSNIAVYGKDHPYAKISSEKTINSIETDYLKNYYESFIRPNNGTLAIVGDFDIDKLTQKLEKLLSKWSKKEIPEYTIPEPKSMATGVYFVERPASVQSAVRYVTKTVPYNSTNYEALTFAAGVIHSGFAGRLFKTLREKYSYTYSPMGGQSGNVSTNKFACGSDVRTNVTDSSISVILNEVGNLANEVPSSEEVDLIKKFRIGMYFMSFENSSYIANLLQNYVLNNKSLELLKTIHKRYQSLTNYDLNKVANEYMNPKNAYIIVVGDKSIKESLQQFGYVYDYDLDINPVFANEKIDLSTKELIKKYTIALGGEDAISKIKTITATGEANMSFSGQEVPGTFEEYRKFPNKMAQTLKLAFDTQIFKYNGKSGYVGNSEGKIDAEGPVLEKLKLEAEMFVETKFLDYDLDLKVMGIKDNDIVLNVIYKDKSERKYYFNKNTFLLNKVESLEDTPQGPINVIKYIDEYITVAGVKLPKIVRSDMQLVVIKYNYNYSINENIEDSVFD